MQLEERHVHPKQEADLQRVRSGSTKGWIPLSEAGTIDYVRHHAKRASLQSKPECQTGRKRRLNARARESGIVGGVVGEKRSRVEDGEEEAEWRSN